MQIVSMGDNLHEMSNPVFCEKLENTCILNLSSAELDTRLVKFNIAVQLWTLLLLHKNIL